MPVPSSIHYLASSDSSPGQLLLGILFFGGLGTLAWGYASFKERGFRPREIQTALRPQQLAEIFTRTVAGSGWKVVDGGNPMIAQSTLLAGIRQQIALFVDIGPNGTRARIAVLRYSKKVFGGATKAYTLRWRMSAFLAEVRRQDQRALVSG